MNPAHLHLWLNHLSIIGFVFGLILLAGGYVIKQQAVRRVALGVFVLSAVFAVPTFLTGEGAEEAVEGLAGIQDSFIETHEDWGSVYIWLAGGLGILSAVTLLFDFRKWPSTPYLYVVVLLLSLVTLGFGAKVGTTGGEIRHTEIRKGALANSPTQSGEDREEHD